MGKTIFVATRLSLWGSSRCLPNSVLLLPIWGINIVPLGSTDSEKFERADTGGSKRGNKWGHLWEIHMWPFMCNYLFECMWESCQSFSCAVGHCWTNYELISMWSSDFKGNWGMIWVLEGHLKIYAFWPVNGVKYLNYLLLLLWKAFWIHPLLGKSQNSFSDISYIEFNSTIEGLALCMGWRVFLKVSASKFLPESWTSKLVDIVYEVGMRVMIFFSHSRFLKCIQNVAHE